METRICFRRVTTPLRIRSLGVSAAVGFDVERLVFESEPGMPIPSLLFTPKVLHAGAPVVVHACEEGKPKFLNPLTLPVCLALKAAAFDQRVAAVAAVHTLASRKNIEILTEEQ